MTTPLPVLTLTYFDAPGIAEPIRHALQLRGVPFVDERIPLDKWPLLKPTFPHGTLPVLTVDGRVYAESQAILRFVGRLTGMYPPSDEPVAALLVDEILDALQEDLWDRVIEPMHVETNPEKKQELCAALLDGPLPRVLAMLDQRLEKIAKYPLFQDASKLYIHEIMVTDYVIRLRLGVHGEIPTTLIDNYSNLLAVYNKVDSCAFPTSLDVQLPPVRLARAASLPKLTLTYFDIHGRAEKIRLALWIGGVAFTDTRLVGDAFETMKPDLPYGQVPVLAIDGNVVAAQTFALLRYAGTLTGLYPVNDPLRALQVDEVVERFRDMYTELDPTFREQDPIRKRAMQETLASRSWPATLDALERRLVDWQTSEPKSSPFVLGGASPTIADIEIFCFVQFVQSGDLEYVPVTLIDPYEALMQVYRGVAAHPRVREWYCNRRFKLGPHGST